MSPIVSQKCLHDLRSFSQLLEVHYSCRNAGEDKVGKWISSLPQPPALIPYSVGTASGPVASVSPQGPGCNRRKEDSTRQRVGKQQAVLCFSTHELPLLDLPFPILLEAPNFLNPTAFISVGEKVAMIILQTPYQAGLNGTEGTKASS